MRIRSKQYGRFSLYEVRKIQQRHALRDAEEETHSVKTVKTVKLTTIIFVGVIVAVILSVTSLRRLDTLTRPRAGKLVVTATLRLRIYLHASTGCHGNTSY